MRALALVALGVIVAAMAVDAAREQARLTQDELDDLAVEIGRW